MKKMLTTLLSILFVFTIAVATQNSNSSTTSTNSSKTNSNRKPIFRANKDQINQAQAILKQRGFYAGKQLGKLDDATRHGLRQYQQAEGLKVTGTLNKITLEKMNIPLTEKQTSM